MCVNLWIMIYFMMKGSKMDLRMTWASRGKNYAYLYEKYSFLKLQFWGRTFHFIINQLKIWCIDAWGVGFVFLWITFY